MNLRNEKVDALRIWLTQIRRRLAMLEAAAPPQARDSELKRRIKEAQIEQSVVLERLAHQLNSQDESRNSNSDDESRSCELSA